MLEIKDLWAQIDGQPILKGISLTVKAGEVHAIMGPNGAGKSTLAKVLAGHPSYEITAGTVLFNGQDLLALPPEERAQAGLFLSFQYPVEVSGLSNAQFLHAARNALKKENLSAEEFEKILDETMKKMEMRAEFKERSLNEGFSGGEKKRNEILQLALFDPKLAILDETDSGLDIDAMRIVAQGINQMRKSDNAMILITHYQRLLDLVKPDVVHVLAEGKIVRSGGPQLALELEEKGYVAV